MASRGTGVEPLSAADASNVYIDAADQVNVFLLAGVLGRGGFVGDDGEPDLSRLRSDLTARLAGDDGLRRLSQRVAGRGGALRWEPCTPDLARHVRRVEPVTGREGLATLCAALMTVPLPEDLPRWELLVVPGASVDGPGIVLRIHHAVADGAAGVGLVQRLFGAPPEDRPDQAGGAVATAGPAGLPDAPPRWRRVLTGLWRVVSVLRRTVPPTVLLGPVSSRRGVAFAVVDLGPLRQRVRDAGATVNDALLSAVAVGVAAGLRGVGEEVPAAVPASVPVALPGRGGSGNAVGVMLVPLPTGEPDGDRRLGLVAGTTRARRAQARGQGTFELTRTRWGSRVFAWLARRQRFVAVFVTNVRGPDHPLSVAGAPLLEAWPVAQIQGNVRLGVTALSYAGRLCCTVHCDARAVPADLVAATLAGELERLAGTAGGRP
ncbi:wax ester/triacylglycerol synthase domain-containing protein [Ornithinimicrobium pekingense]|uniref:diacylglycerol O-acyltransferase n=1 Tax=Ornithinimicrobium pekingense TaxID=384677 RepID=A0ABQ2F6C0_9MICO|nr:wax ester/triacylglycerol synthase domain-containing protein [Ornithinimicrobium pekingense]GGK57448.1 hypothetical protein GCM10011509_02280 [Ornithinimicrobium pekingense]